MSTLRAGFIGLGAMGDPMARNLHAAGILEGVWNRTDETARRFADDTGSRHFGTIEALAESCNVVCLCVSADEDVMAVVDRLKDAVAEGTVVIDFSTVRGDTARQAASLLEPAGARFLDCPVSGGTEGAIQGSLSIMAGGDTAALEHVMPVLQAVGKATTHMGPVGAGQATKAANQIAVAGVNQAVSQALAFAAAEGLDVNDTIEALSGGAAASWFLTNRGPNMAKDEYPLGFRVSLHEKDLKICREMSEKHGVALPLVEMTLVHYRRLMEQRHGDEDISALHRLMADMFPSG